jgi:photosystem II reaction center protein Psb28
MARIEFSPGIEEVPTQVRLLKSKTGSRGSAIFRFEELKTDTQNILGMRMIDEEGELTTRNITAKFLNGEFKAPGGSLRHGNRSRVGALPALYGALLGNSPDGQGLNSAGLVFGLGSPRLFNRGLR